MKDKTLRLRNQLVHLPVYMPDATLGVVRSVDCGLTWRIVAFKRL